MQSKDKLFWGVQQRLLAISSEIYASQWPKVSQIFQFQMFTIVLCTRHDNEDFSWAIRWGNSHRNTFQRFKSFESMKSSAFWRVAARRRLCSCDPLPRMNAESDVFCSVPSSLIFQHRINRHCAAARMSEPASVVYVPATHCWSISAKNTIKPAI